jgi:hypothetical protein
MAQSHPMPSFTSIAGEALNPTGKAKNEISKALGLGKHTLIVSIRRRRGNFVIRVNGNVVFKTLGHRDDLHVVDPIHRNGESDAASGVGSIFRRGARSDIVDVFGITIRCFDLDTGRVGTVVGNSCSGIFPLALFTTAEGNDH